MRLTWSRSRGDAQSLGFSVISLLGDVDREKGRKTRDIKKGDEPEKKRTSPWVRCMQNLDTNIGIV